MATSFISWLRLFDNSFMQSHAIKVSSIWFDEIVVQVPRPEMTDSIVDMISNKESISVSTSEEIKKIFIPVQSKLKGYKFLESNPWNHENDELLRVVEEVTKEEFIKEYPDVAEGIPDPEFMHEVTWVGAGLIESVDLWGLLNKAESIGFLANELESVVIQRVFAASGKHRAHELFTACAEKRIPNIQELTWDKVIELRNNPFMEQFRRKVTEIQERVSSTNDALELIQEVERKDMVDYIRLTKPSSTSMSLIKLVSSNMPLPIPINPVSIALGINDYLREREILQRYGWLYFLFDLADE